MKQLPTHCDYEQNVIVAIANKEEIQDTQHCRGLSHHRGHYKSLLDQFYLLLLFRSLEELFFDDKRSERCR